MYQVRAHYGIAGMGDATGFASEVMPVATQAVSLIPVVGPLLASVTSVLGGIFGQMSLTGRQKVAATHIVDQIGDALQQNLDAYLAGPRTSVNQAAALANFDNGWNAVLSQCGQSSLGTAGQRCITDRQKGSCAYKTSPGGWSADGKTYTPPGPNGSGSTCWNWFVGMRDPIANDPGVIQVSGSGGVGGAIDSISGALGLSSSSGELLLGVGLLAAGFVMLGGSGGND
jgi:hypothetical protein